MLTVSIASSVVPVVVSGQQCGQSHLKIHNSHLFRALQIAVFQNFAHPLFLNCCHYRVWVYWINNGGLENDLNWTSNHGCKQCLNVQLYMCTVQGGFFTVPP